MRRAVRVSRALMHSVRSVLPSFWSLKATVYLVRVCACTLVSHCGAGGAGQRRCQHIEVSGMGCDTLNGQGRRL